MQCAYSLVTVISVFSMEEIKAFTKQESGSDCTILKNLSQPLDIVADFIEPLK